VVRAVPLVQRVQVLRHFLVVRVVLVVQVDQRHRRVLELLELVAMIERGLLVHRVLRAGRVILVVLVVPLDQARLAESRFLGFLVLRVVQHLRRVLVVLVVPVVLVGKACMVVELLARKAELVVFRGFLAILGHLVFLVFQVGLVFLLRLVGQANSKNRKIRHRLLLGWHLLQRRQLELHRIRLDEQYGFVHCVESYVVDLLQTKCLWLIPCSK